MAPLLAQAPAAPMDPDDLENNPGANASLHDTMAAKLHRRHVLKGGVGALTMARLGLLGPRACACHPLASASGPTAAVLGFTAVGKSLADRISVPDGHTATVIHATGDTLDPAIGDCQNDGTDGNFGRRSGDHRDGMHYLGLSAGAGPRPEAETLKKSEAHGASVVEIAQTAGVFGVLKASAFNRCVTPRTPMTLNGPARGSAPASGWTTSTAKRASTSRGCASSTTCPSPTAAGFRAPAASPAMMKAPGQATARALRRPMAQAAQKRARVRPPA